MLWFIIAGALAVFTLDLVLLLRGATHSFDHDTLVWIDGLRSGPLDRIITFITNTGGNGRAVPIVLATGFFLMTGRRLEVISFLGAAGIAQLTTYGLKALVQRDRPAFLDVANLPTDTSFPSGHALGSTVVYGLLALWLWREGHAIPAAGLAVWALTISVSRIYLGVHYATDVLASVCLGVAFLAATVLVYQHFQAGLLS